MITSAMIALDTHVIVRFLTGDDRAQSSRARTLIESGPVFVATTVLLETEWVIRRAYGFSRNQIIRSLRDFCGLPNVTLENSSRIAACLKAMDQGLDFAGALHLEAARDCEAFATFDRGLIQAGATSGAPLRAL